MILVEFIYISSALLLAAYGLHCLLMAWLYRKARDQSREEQAEVAERQAVETPMVTVQLPLYNERHVADRLIEAAVGLDWPAGRLQIQVLNDSTDDTGEIVAAALRRHADSGLQFEHIRRPVRRDYKAGALRHGLARATGSFIAIFDADFLPPPDFLRRAMSRFAQGDDVGCVQTRWGHVNPDASWLTKAQALGIDGHFIVEQTARHRASAFLNFNGTAGVWRRQCLEEAGGWQADTLTEDLDLSYRAQLNGWRIVYEPAIVVPAELPEQINAFKRQQFRWAKGSIQTSLKLLGRLWRAPQPLWRKLLGTLHMTNYAVHPLLLLNLLLTLPLTLSNSGLLHLTPFLVLSAVGPSAMYLTAGRAQALSLSEQIRRLAVLIALGVGISANNARAVLEAIFGVPSEFLRTPKFAATGRGGGWQSSAYVLPRAAMTWVELALAAYAAGLLLWSLSQGNWWLILWLLIYAAGYGYVGSLSLVQARQIEPAGT